MEGSLCSVENGLQAAQTWRQEDSRLTEEGLRQEDEKE